MDTDAFMGLNLIKTLDLSNNEIRYFKPKLHQLRSLLILLIRNNPIQLVRTKTFERGMSLYLVDSDSECACCIVTYIYDITNDCNAVSLYKSSCVRLLSIISLSVFLWLMIIVSMATNTLVLFFHWRKIRTNVSTVGWNETKCVLHLCIAYYCVIIYMVCLVVYDLIFMDDFAYECQWLASVSCKIMVFINTCFLYISSYYMLIITLSRLMNIVSPLHARQFSSVWNYVLYFGWFSDFSVGVLVTSFHTSVNNMCTAFEFSPLIHKTRFSFMVLMVLTIVRLLVTVFCCFLICYHNPHGTC